MSAFHITGVSLNNVREDLSKPAHCSQASVVFKDESDRHIDMTITQGLFTFIGLGKSLAYKRDKAGINALYRDFKKDMGIDSIDLYVEAAWDFSNKHKWMNPYEGEKETVYYEAREYVGLNGFDVIANHGFDDEGMSVFDATTAEHNNLVWPSHKDEYVNAHGHYLTTDASITSIEGIMSVEDCYGTLLLLDINHCLVDGISEDTFIDGLKDMTKYHAMYLDDLKGLPLVHCDADTIIVQ